MVSKEIKNNATDLAVDLQWFSRLLDTRIRVHKTGKTGAGDISAFVPPDISKGKSVYADFVRHYKLSAAERLLLLLCLVPGVKPEILDVLFLVNPAYDRGHTEFGGLRGHHHGGFIPTGETFLFIAAGDNLESRFSLMELFSTEHFFYRHNILRLETAPEGESFLSGALTISRELVEYFTIGKAQKPDLSPSFPAKRITTSLNWDDLVLEDKVLKQIEEIKVWLDHGKTLLYDWGMERKLRKGYRCLFYGPPGTGKTMTACLLGKYAGMDVYRIDLSLVVSKYIGETEKNLAKVFNQAEHKNWILFFDEADALFGKRTEVGDAHDRYANQEVSYLLQRIESHDGVVLLASNMKENMDDSFTRRFESMIHFQMPRKIQRKQLWQQGFSTKSKLSKDVDIDIIAERYELSGGAIMNVISFASLKALNIGETTIRNEFLVEGIRKEFVKEGRTV
jgi:hypothetical protein